ncbi:66934f05-7cad-4ba3-8b2b-371968fb8ebe [Sclerotinia trifoliorum]|uniref:66934f05-7cad-4ba3-8b2b-371968fb8ebe n=1 Tax=Sclerotinia trifoliorum TaxID=28548 RepID=A0A8H2VX32_9HELO|nr:66934f05-7cad-4ba3-8b2b-371968fb8ebe [Sclerotinia trifoliorum]
MARMLAPIVRYNDVQWRAIKSKANNNHPSLKPEDIEIIKEVIRVHNAILNNTDPTPLSQFQDSIRYDERQVIKYFLWSKTREHNSTLTLISTYYLPKRRPQGGVSKQQKQADEAMRPRRDPRGTTYGFVRRPERRVDDAAVDTAVENGGSEGVIGVGSEVAENGGGESGIGNEAPAMGSSPRAKQNPAGKNNPGGKKQMLRLKLRSNTSNEFLRRSERIVGGAAKKNFDISMEGIREVAMNEDTSTTNDMRSSKRFQDSTDSADSTGSMGSRGSSNSAPSDETNDTPIGNDTISNNTYASPYIPLNTAYKSPYTPIPEIDDKAPGHESTFSAEDVDNTYDSSFVAEGKSQGSNSNNTVLAEDPEEHFPPGMTNKLPYDPFSNAGYQFEERDSTISALGADERDNARFEDMEVDG